MENNTEQGEKTYPKSKIRIFFETPEGNIVRWIIIVFGLLIAVGIVCGFCLLMSSALYV
jgi:hypothetical protein